MGWYGSGSSCLQGTGPAMVCCTYSLKAGSAVSLLLLPACRSGTSHAATARLSSSPHHEATPPCVRWQPAFGAALQVWADSPSPPGAL